MEYIELSPESLKDKCKDLASLIEKDKFDYDLVVFVGRGALPIGMWFSEYSKVPLLEIKTVRKGNKLKKVLSPLLKVLPKKVLIDLRNKEAESKYHDRKNTREVSYNHKKYEQYRDKRKILLIDDSIDSGNTIVACFNKLHELNKDADIRVAAIVYFDRSIYKPKYYLYKDYLLCGPWSNDSKYNSLFEKEYKRWKEEYDK